VLSADRLRSPDGGACSGLMGLGHVAGSMRRGTRSAPDGGVVDQRLESAPAGVDLDLGSFGGRARPSGTQ
jgi:hypothetical protein